LRPRLSARRELSFGKARAASGERAAPAQAAGRGSFVAGSGQGRAAEAGCGAGSRLRIVQAEQDPDPDTAAISADAQICAADARRSWAALFPEAAAATDTGRAMQLIWAPGAEALYLEAVCTATWARMQGFTPLIERRTSW